MDVSHGATSENSVKNNEKGFTLLEMIAVVVIIGIAIAIVFPNVNQSNSALEEDLMFSQFESVLQKGIADARALGEEVTITFEESGYSILSSKPNRFFDYAEKVTLDEADHGKELRIDRNGTVQEELTLRLSSRDDTFDVVIGEGLKNVWVNGTHLSDIKREGGK